jgi:uncharacterized protein
MSRWPIIALILLISACNKPPAEDNINFKTVRLPDGRTVQAEVLMRSNDMMRGMMFRTSLAEDRGLLFVHSRPGKYSYWMHNVKVPLDIIWMDKERRIVEISPKTPPCTADDPTKCPQYGGTVDSQFVLELAGGMAAKYGLSIGQVLDF